MLPPYNVHRNFLSTEFLLSDRKKSSERRYVLKTEYGQFEKQRREAEKPKKRYVNPIKRARRWKQFLDKNPELNNTLLAKRLRVSRVRVVHALSLLRLPEWAQETILNTTGVSERSLRPLVHIQSKKVFKAAFEQILADKVWQLTQTKTPILLNQEVIERQKIF